ncbi:MAG TPA: hypothetical protein VMU63_06175 [Acidimicrobiales bacterium]|nr:hypothetical protein [Acidimicrobiales bacterium]
MTPDRDGLVSAERVRLQSRRQWRQWGPYLSERAWGTVREDYSAEGNAWDFFPHDHARSRAYRWSEDGLAGICDDQQRLCFAFAFWNGRDAILKERIFGLSGPQGNHGEDAKEYWWYEDATPSHAWLRWRYMYPQAPFPYDELVQVNASRTKDQPEYELLDTGVFSDGRYWDISVDYAKASPDDICIRLRARNAGPEPARLHALPTLWFRNTWSWQPGAARPSISAHDDGLRADHLELGEYRLSGGGDPEVLVCENESNLARLFGAPAATPWPKDGIGDYVVAGTPAVNPDGVGTKGALHYVLDAGPGQTVELKLRLRRRGDDATPVRPAPGLGTDWEEVMATRRSDADAFYADIIPAGAGPAEAAVARQACAGMIWSQQFFHYDVERWLDGDPTEPPPPVERLSGRNSGWRHLNNRDVISMPDKWEYPWYASWDLAFHCVVLAHLDPELAKEQLVLLCREWYMHPDGQLPAYEWKFEDVNPPVQAWAALRVFEIDGSTDFEFLERVLHKLLLNFNWWVNRKDSQGSNVFEGGFLGLDNIGPIDRSAALPVAGRLEQSDGTAWMAMYCLNLLEMSMVLAAHDEVYEDVATKFFEHFTYIAAATSDQGLWDEQDGFYYDVLQLGDGQRFPLRVRSLVGLIPLCAVTVLDSAAISRLPDFSARMRWFVANKPHYAQSVFHGQVDGTDNLMLSVVSPDRLRRLLEAILSEAEFLSPYGLRSVSAFHRDHPFQIDVEGIRGSVDYEPAESRTGLFGGNSNWRGPIWFPLNYLVIEALRRFDRHFGTDFVVEDPTGFQPGRRLSDVADDLGKRLLDIFLPGPDGRRPVFGGYELFQTDPDWHDLIPFHEYFHGDTGAGLGASHQTGWTGLVADLVLDRRRSPG